ncbi:geminin-like [Temnothorax curvispinosus]|uniref:Geminin-like n=1 Tax=Temnothorax curvispinosus TaxID=300111 RepID=A0A6J1R1N3_9HYME|nr:geminin-like [Temnothorax curvispinosus]XP_024888538.1 geminin-like [Temnothorax curvispinosus]
MHHELVNTVAPKIKDRKPLHTLQPAATDKDTLVGADRTLRSCKSKEAKTKQDVTNTGEKDTSKCTKVTKKNKAVQTTREKIQIEVEDLTSDNPSENYWQILAERKQTALVDALEENKKLVQQIEKLVEENHVYKEMLDEMRTLVEVLQEQIEDDRSDIEDEDDRNDINNSLDDSAL